MEKKVLDKIKNALERHKKNLMSWLKQNGHSKNSYLGMEGKPDEPQTASNLPIIEKIDETIEQINKGNYGKCLMCNGEVEADRLVMDFTTCVCLDHYSEFELRELERDLELAAKVQQHMLPGSMPAVDGVQMAAISRSARVVGGDYYDFFRYRDFLQGLAIADVMGKGVPAGMLMANLQASLRILGPDHHELHDLATHMNKLFRFNLKQIRFITLFLAALDMENKMLYYANAGHHPPLLWQAASGSHCWLKPTGPAIGLIPEAVFTSESIQLDTGDLLMLYTDGLVEARNGKEEFGVQRLLEYTGLNHTKPAQTFLNSLLREVQEYAGGITDDLTVMVVKVD